MGSGAGVNRAGQRQQPVPGRGAVFQRLFSGQAGLALKLADQLADPVGGDVDVVVAGQQPAFLGEQQEHDPHHHRDHARVELVVIDPGQQPALGLVVQPVQRPGQHLHCVADLLAERLGYFLATFQALPEQCRQLVRSCDGEEP